jgi:predicted nucleic acid-binding protein
MLHCTPADFDAAALVYRTCRSRGATIRRLVDCLIAAVAIRTGSPILHADGDFNVLARHVDLAVHPASLPDA